MQFTDSHNWKPSSFTSAACNSGLYNQIQRHVQFTNIGSMSSCQDFPSDLTGFSVENITSGIQGLHRIHSGMPGFPSDLTDFSVRESIHFRHSKIPQRSEGTESVAQINVNSQESQMPELGFRDLRDTIYVQS